MTKTHSPTPGLVNREAPGAPGLVRNAAMTRVAARRRAPSCARDAGAEADIHLAMTWRQATPSCEGAGCGATA